MITIHALKVSNIVNLGTYHIYYTLTKPNLGIIKLNVEMSSRCFGDIDFTVIEHGE